MAKLKEGDKAPDFTARDGEGQTVRLKDLRGKKIVLYFYPKDDTPGCTKEACSFRDSFAKFKKRGIDVPYLVKDNEGHGFSNEENRFEFYEAMENFLAKYL